jgi:hypothetical protein
VNKGWSKGFSTKPCVLASLHHTCDLTDAQHRTNILLLTHSIQRQQGSDTQKWLHTRLLERCHGQMLSARQYSVKIFLINVHQTAQKLCSTDVNRLHHCGRNIRVKYCDLCTSWTGNVRPQGSVADSGDTFMKKWIKGSKHVSIPYWKFRAMKQPLFLTLWIHNSTVGVWCAVCATKIN